MRIEIFYDADKVTKPQFYWRAVANNGRIVADGAEGYASKSNARRAARRFIDRMRSMPEPQIVVLD